MANEEKEQERRMKEERKGRKSWIKRRKNRGEE